MEKEVIDIKQVLKAIERCIQAFWTFVKTDSTKPWWKLRTSLWTCQPVENPRDLKLFADLTRKLHKVKFKRKLATIVFKSNIRHHFLSFFFLVCV